MSLRIECLGGFTVVRADASDAGSAFVTRKAAALFKILLTERRRTVTAEQLIDWLWPGIDPALGAANLRPALSRVRRALEPDLPQYAPSKYIARIGDGYRFVPGDDTWIDADAFEQHIAAGERHLKEGRLADAGLAFGAARGLYGGEYLAEDRYADWAQAERERLRERHLGLLGQLAECHGRQGQYRAAAALCRESLAIDDCREAVWRQLMRYLAFAGDQAEAQCAYERCRAVLADALDTEPVPETRALLAEIRRGTLTAPAAAGPRAGLPEPPSRLVGRDAELAELMRQLAAGPGRLVTLTGPGGCGKTRLAIEAARRVSPRFADGARFVRLAPVRSAQDMVDTIAAGVALSLHGWQDPQAQLLHHLRDKAMVLVLDDFEHLIEDAPWVATLVAHAPALVILATSRESLKLDGEVVIELAGLDHGAVARAPATGRSAAAEMFLQAARRVHARFAPSAAEDRAIARLCRLVEGLPLAIELAAAWVRVLPCDEIADAIAEDIDVLARVGAPATDRHRSMRAVYEHSWQLLSKDEQRVLSRLAVFRGGFDRAAAAAVAGASLSTLLSLVHKSLLQQHPGGRYDMHGLLRQWSAEKLAADPAAARAVRDRHARSYAGLLGARVLHLAIGGPRATVAEIDVELENLRAAWQHAAGEGSVEVIDAALEGLYLYHDLRTTLHEGRRAFRLAVEGLARAGDAGGGRGATERRRVLGHALACEAMLAWRTGDPDAARHGLEWSLSLLEPLAAGPELAFARYTLGYVLGAQAETPAMSRRAEALLESSLAAWRDRGNTWRVARVLNALGLTRMRQGDLGGAIQAFEDALAAAEAIGDQRTTAHILDYLGVTHHLRGDLGQARDCHERSAGLFRDLGVAWGLAEALISLARDCIAAGEPAESERWLEESLAIGRETGIGWIVEQSSRELAGLRASGAGVTPPTVRQGRPTAGSGWFNNRSTSAG